MSHTPRYMNNDLTYEWACAHIRKRDRQTSQTTKRWFGVHVRKRVRSKQMFNRYHNREMSNAQIS